MEGENGVRSMYVVFNQLEGENSASSFVICLCEHSVEFGSHIGIRACKDTSIFKKLFRSSEI